MSNTGLQLWEVINNRRDNELDTTALGIWTRACEYFKWCDDNPITWKSMVMSGTKAGTKFENESPHPYSIKALCAFCSISEAYLSYIRNTKDMNSDYYLVISKILSIIYVQNLNYATTGVFNPVFTARLLSIGEDVTVPEPVKVEVITQDIPKLSSSENEVLEKLELEKSFLDLEKEAKKGIKKS
jgi:hypothetical protein